MKTATEYRARGARQPQRELRLQGGGKGRWLAVDGGRAGDLWGFVASVIHLHWGGVKIYVTYCDKVVHSVVRFSAWPRERPRPASVLGRVTVCML